MTETISRAPLILVVGPSGAGKDSLMMGAAERLAKNPRFHFARRVVTRPVQPGGEAHDSIAPEVFAALEQDGFFLLSWRAHGLAYGVPRDLDSRRQDGVAVIANVSRSVIETARCHCSPVGVIAVTAPIGQLAERLAARGREDAQDIRRRLERAGAGLPRGADVVTLVNDSSLDTGIERFVAALKRLYPAGS